MSALARYSFKEVSTLISGSDREYSELISTLITEGIKDIWSPHSKENIKKINPDIVIYSTAIENINEELKWAKENNKLILHRADLLEYFTSSKKLISISGTHGKTTTTAMVAEVLLKNNFSPSVVLGGILLAKNTNIITDSGEYFVIEADESDKSLLKGNPEIGVITNIEPDHLENFPHGFEEIKNSFLEFAKKSVLNKGLVFCLSDKTTKELITNNFDLDNPKLISYGFCSENNAPKISTKYNATTKSWDIYLKENFLTSMQLKYPGEHYILNALATFSVCYLIGISPEKIKESLENYKGVKRRFQIISNKEITIIDDYAHHPTEIHETIKAAKSLNPKRLIIVLQPHQPRRLKDLWNEFIKILKSEESITFVTDIYIARGKNINNISSEKLIQEINKPNINYLPGNINEITDSLKKIIKPNDLILIMGAGNITEIGQKLLGLHKREQVAQNKY